jgi:hypothetical protein
MKRIIFLAVLALIFASPAYAASVGHYPSVFVDDGCTDDFNAPGTRTQALAALVLSPAVQTSGASDIGCDHDPRIRETALTESTTFGPFKMPHGRTGIIVFADANDVTADAGTWTIEILRGRPVDMVAVVAATTASQNSEGDVSFGFGPDDQNAVTMSTNAAEIDATIPSTFWIKLKFGTATAWEGTLSWVAF